MSDTVLLLSTATRWYGVARAPRALAKAGFDVCLLTPREGLADKSRFVGKIAYLPDNATTLQWLYAFAEMVNACAPRLVIPCDDTSFRLLAALATTPPDGMRPDLRLRLATLIRDSMGDPAFYATSVDKTLLAPAAQALGVAVPPHVVVTAVDAALEFAAANGYPVVAKRGYGTAGDAVSICADATALRDAVAGYLRPDPSDFAGGGDGRVLVQAHVPGQIRFYQVTAWRGALVAGMVADRVLGHPEPKGPATVVRLHGDPAMHEACAKLVRGFGMSGTASIEFVVDANTGVAYLLEINRRVSPGWHQGPYVGTDHAKSLYAAVTGTPATVPGEVEPGKEATIAHFPQEWLRDPFSPNLTRYPVDVPWDEPELFEAMLSLRNE
jgi:predicted ATP-grasp superfamily ATP-dependent carboligase